MNSTSSNREDTKSALMRDFKHSLPMELLKAREAAMARFRPMLRQHGLTEQQWRVIRALAEFRKISAGELAQQSFLLAPSLTRILQHLEREKIVKRSSDSHDQRRSTFVLSVKGQRLFAEVAPDSEALYAEIERDFGRRKFDELYELLSEFTEFLATGTADRTDTLSAEANRSCKLNSSV